MHRTTLTLFLLACSLTAHATDPWPKTVTTGYAGACQGGSATDDARIRRGPLFGTALAPASVICSPAIDSSENGAYAFGATFGNTSAVNVVVTCTSEISTVGPGAQVKVTRSVMISPKSRAGLSWSAQDVGEGRTYRGGQVGFTCTLPTGVTVSNVWTRSVAN